MHLLLIYFFEIYSQLQVEYIGFFFCFFSFTGYNVILYRCYISVFSKNFHFVAFLT